MPASPPKSVALITGLEPDPFRPGAVRLLVNGRTFCTIPAEMAQSEALVVGRAFDDAAQSLAGLAADTEAAYRTALRALERRSFARADLGRRLIRKGHPREAVERALARAGEVGLLDDTAFARQYVSTRAARGRGPARLARDLSAMGVERGLVDGALAAEFPPDRDPLEAARALATRRAAQLGALPRSAKLRRLLAYLGRRGFTGSGVSAMVRSLVERGAGSGKLSRPGG